MRRMLPNEIVSIATGGISTLDEVATLADVGCVPALSVLSYNNNSIF